jgi:hypothetical protein
VNSNRWGSQLEYANYCNHQFQLIETFDFWLPHARSLFSVSRSIVARAAGIISPDVEHDDHCADSEVDQLVTFN